MTLTQILQIVPPVVWSGILGALLALLGVNMQLRYNAKERERERQMQLRRDVYLEAAEGVAGSMDYFFRYTRADITLSQIGDSTAMRTGWLNKVYTVASLDTIEAFAEASAALAASSLDLVRIRITVEEVLGNVKIEQQRIESIQKYQEQIKSTVAAIANEPPSQQVLSRLEELQRQMDDSWSQIRDSGAKLDWLTTEHWRLLRVLLEQAVNYAIGYQKKLRLALLSLRRELELPLDSQAYEQLMDRIDQKMLPRFQALLKAIDDDNASTPSG
jgi:predicted  nucleic acid-binding Zn-ribbon protein